MTKYLEDWVNKSDHNQRICAQEDLIMNVTEDLLVAMEGSGMTKSDLAKRLGKSKSFVTQILSGARNMTLKTLSDICFVLNIEPNFNLNNSDCHPMSKSGWEDEECFTNVRPLKRKAYSQKQVFQETRDLRFASE
ncbi:helix-turn-helix transcriptional regulator [Endozoicomonas arenosclerae]|uniref:helix-turn-helix transcriptional regulator n=1 Tax=Endozoicomonas arenosclerae TaxID=1633495 RepID=UPI0007803846|nr:helix-turn-helix transcriptional regulator [Endozoicomonas arenosclerae]